MSDRESCQSLCRGILGIFGFTAMAACTPAASEKSADAQAPELARQLNANKCSACHSVNQARVGPSMIAIAERYGPSDAEALALSIRSGSKQKWGAAPMPEQPHIDGSVSRELAEQILSLSDR